MGFKFLEHESEIGILASGHSIESAFSEGAKALFEIMVNIKSINPSNTLKIKCSANSLNSLFVEFLNELIAQKDISEMVFSEFEINISNNFILECTAKGELFNPNKHGSKIEAKAATYSGLKVWEEKNEFFAQCIIDV